ncbi:hypothetical protein TrCOL_g4310 [Triparma columacea]|uniref:Lipocalin/cytosolic fatty-acid binding domain-containing protein n=1 Tax=Triparma columacea TaxID=722753 RepID=A0A9W7LCH4_9STRA|nr:hypothetical protein TrCOL_g4310 [Triparma columacea]
MKFLSSILALSLFASASAVSCPDFTTADDKFDLQAYMGKWYEVEKSSQFASIFERNGYCITAEYTDNNDGTVKVDNAFLKGGPDGDRTDAIATAKQIEGARLGVSFFLPKFDFSYQSYNVVSLEGTKDDGYDAALVYSCDVKFGLIKTESLWVLSRTPTLADSVVDNFYEEAAGMGIDVEGLNMIRNDITGCYSSTLGSTSVFDGSYSDPNHPGCGRTVEVASNGVDAAVYGEDGDEGSPDCANPVQWGPLAASVNGNNIKIDFSPKGGPSDLTAEYDSEDDGILFSDGNLWSKIE